MRSRSLTIDRVTMQAGVKQAITPDRHASGCTIQNATPDEVQLHTTNDDDAHYLIIAPGFERDLPKLHDNNTTYGTEHPAFWLRAVQDGTVILIWT